MAFANYFYHSTTRRYIALFGSMFKELTLARKDAEGNEVQRVLVPINYGPYQKWLIKVTQDKDLNYKPAVVLPRMAFEISGISYDGPRKLGSLKKMDLADNKTVYTGVPYNIDFTLTIMTKYAEDATQIVEQIIPFFKPEKTYSVKLLEGLDYIDIPITLTSVTSDDAYEADFETRRAILWTLTFTMKAWYFAPVREPKRIKFIDVRTYMKDNPTVIDSHVTVRPGLTEGGEPTTDPDQSIPYQNIEEDDDWASIIVIEENIPEEEA